MVMFAPKAIPSGWPPVNSAGAARPRAITSTAAALVANAPPRLAFASRQAADRVEHLARDLRPARPVEVSGAAGQRGKAVADGIDVEHPRDPTRQAPPRGDPLSPRHSWGEAPESRDYQGV